jgi:hypothetical protein
MTISVAREPGHLSRYSDGLDDRCSNLSRRKNFLLTASIPVLGLTQLPIQWAGGEAAEVKSGGVIFHSLIHLHGVMLNY